MVRLSPCDAVPRRIPGQRRRRWNVADGGPLSGLGCPVSGLTVGPDAYSFRVSAVDSGGIWSVYSVAAVATSEVSIQTIQAPDECLLQPGIFQVTRTGATLPITVGYSIAGSVVAGVDYEPLPGSVVIPAGATSEDITMTTLNDPNMTDNLPFTVTLSSGAGYLLASGQSQAASQLYDGTAYQPVQYAYRKPGGEPTKRSIQLGG